MSFTIRKKHIRFTGAELLESTEYLKNPSRGWYRIYSFSLEERPDFDELYWCLCAEEGLALVMVDIGAFRARAISEEALATFADILRFFSGHNKEIILRVVYDREGRGMEREPDFQQTVEGHMRQLGPVVREFTESIFLVQGLLIGSWGEMHDSRFLAKDRLKKLAQVWRDAIGSEICIAVRTPQQWRMLHGQEATPGESKIGLFDDGMFGSEDNLGTYGVFGRKDAGWEERWRREDELSWIGEIARFVPYGGEAVGTSEVGALPEVVAEMRQTGLTYLNRTHDMRRLEAWKQSTWSGSGVWNGCNGLDYIGCHMGYRLVVRKAEFKQRCGEACLIVLIENVGFAAFREKASLSLIFEAENKERICGTYPCDMQGIGCGEQMQVCLKIPDLKPEGAYAVSIQVRRERDGQIVRFANEPAADRVRLGMLVVS